MTFMWCTGPCLCCRTLFSFNPDTVPSFLFKGEREPICETCMLQINAKRRTMGLNPHAIPPGAYEPQEVN